MSQPENRLRALELALQYSKDNKPVQWVPGKPADVIRTAEMFRKFIEDHEVPEA